VIVRLDVRGPHERNGPRIDDDETPSPRGHRLQSAGKIGGGDETSVRGDRIRAEHQEAHEEQSESWLVHERSMQVYERTVPLPVEVKAEKAEATLENGVLHITLPKVESGKSLTNRIKISVPKLKLPRIGKKESKVKVKGHVEMVKEKLLELQG
jgi:hypothetical protein